MTLNSEELLTEFEAAYEDDQKAAALTSQAKVIKDSIADRLEDFAGDIEANKKYIKEAYTRFKKLKTGKLKATDEDYYALMEAVDEFFIEEENSDSTDTE